MVMASWGHSDHSASTANHDFHHGTHWSIIFVSILIKYSCLPNRDSFLPMKYVMWCSITSVLDYCINVSNDVSLNRESLYSITVRENIINKYCWHYIFFFYFNMLEIFYSYINCHKTGIMTYLGEFRNCLVS